jgi:hypothetical protein
MILMERSVGSLLVMSDDELAQIIALSRRPDGSHHIDITGLEDASQDQRAALAKRLQ